MVSQDSSNRNSTKAFNIGSHLDRLTSDGGSQSKNEHSYHCPICNAANFKVTIAGPKEGHYFTRGCSCMDTDSGKQAIIDAISPRWEKPSRPKSSETFTYEALEDLTPRPIVQVRRADDGTGKRKFSQWHRVNGKWVTGLPSEVRSALHLYRIHDAINQKAITHGEPLLIVEGEGKVNRLIKLGVAATCAIGGGGKWTAYGYPNYLQDLEGAAVVICPDRDTPGMDHAAQIAEDFPGAPWLYPNPTSFQWGRGLPSSKGFDIADWIDDGATKEQILGAIEPRRPDPKPVTELPPSDALPSVTELPPARWNSEQPTRLQRDYGLIEDAIGDDLSFDEATQNFYLSGELFDLETAKLNLSVDPDLGHRLPIKSGKEDVMGICVKLAQKHTFNAVTAYLDHCSTLPLMEIGNLASTLLGSTEPLQNIYLRKWLIAAVARAYQPGCQADDTLILQGDQGQRKSSFFSDILPCHKWLNPNGLKGGKVSDEEVRTAHRVWLIEVPEIDKTFKRACASELKAFMTLRQEWIRPLYANLPILLPRHSLMAGTTNEHEFFTDSTGNRRYWIVSVTVPKIDSAWLVENRDRIWGAAVNAYRNGEQWWLSETEEAEQKGQNQEFQLEHPWHGAIEFHLTYENEITVGEIFKDVLKLEVQEVGRAEQMQVASILKILGFRKTGRRKNVLQQRQPIWIRKKLAS